MGKNRSISNSIGSLIKHARLQKNLSLKDLETLSNVSATYICRLENNDRKCPSVPIISVLAETLDLDLAELLEIAEGKVSDDIKELSTLILGSDFTINSQIAERNVKEELVSLIETILKVDWKDAKLSDSYEILQRVENLKEVLA